MKEIIKKVSFTICIMLLLISMGCGTRWMFKGQVVDAQTSLPISGAAVFIEWLELKGLPGLTYSSKVEAAEDLTDVKGFFQLPKYSTMSKHYNMAVYIKGYVCWNNVDIFPTFEKRTDFRFNNGMIIKLQRFKEEYSKLRHAAFTVLSSIGSPSTGIFDKAIKVERDIY